MAVYDVELVSLPATVPTADVASLLGRDAGAIAQLLGQLPAVVAPRVDELHAETLFHELRALGGEVTLKPAFGPPSQRPNAGSFRPQPSRPPSSPSAPAAPATPFAPPSVEPIDLPDDFELPNLELDETGALHSQPPASGPSSGSLPHDATVPAIDPYGAPPPRTPPPESAPVGSVHSPSARVPVDDEPLGEARASFFELLPFAYLYAFDPGVMLRSVLVALVAAFLRSIFSFGLVAFIGMLLFLGVIAIYLFAIVRHASMNRPGAPAPADTATDDLFASAGRFILAFVVPFWLLVFLAVKLSPVASMAAAVVDPFAFVSPLIVGASILWLLYLPSSLILAAHGSGCLGGLNLVAGVRLIARAPFGYLLLHAALVPVGALLIAASIGGAMASVVLPFGGAYVTTILWVFPLVMGARLLGLFMYAYEYELGIV